MTKGIIIAIDGPVASGKGTLAPLLAEKLNGFYLQTGAMYRCVALYSLDHNLTSSEEIVQSLPNIHIDFQHDKTILNGNDVTFALHENRVSVQVSWIATIKEVRASLIEQQRRIGTEKKEQGIIVIAEGRDTGTAVFPDADIKLFLDASLETRAKRRFAQLIERKEDVTFKQVLNDTKLRDESDQQKSGALVTDPKNHGYTIIESTGLTQEVTLERILKLLKEKEII